MKNLPVNDYTIYTFKIPSTGEEKRFRPFVMKENKALLIAQASEDDNIMLNTLKSVLQSTCMDDIDVDALSSFDCEYLLIKLRSISISDSVMVTFMCNGDSEKHDTQKSREYTTKLDLGKIEVVGLDKFSLDIKMSENLYVKMKLPTLETIRKITSFSNGNNSDEDVFDALIPIVASLIDYIADGEEVIRIDDEVSNEELIEWIEQLTQDQFDKLITFCKSIPYCRTIVEWDCPLCGHHNVRVISGISSFF